MSEWQPIETAPKDGTVVEVRNILTHERRLDARWDGAASHWLLVKDYDVFMPITPGALVVPDEWREA